MGKINLLTFDKPNGDRVEIGNGYILMVDSRFKDKDNIMLIDDSDYTKVQLNGETVDCLYVMGDVPYTPIIAMSGDRLDSITGGHPLSYKDVVYEADGNFSSPDGLCRGTFIVDEVTGDKRLWYGRKSIPEDIKVFNGDNISQSIHPDTERDYVFIKSRNTSNGYKRISFYGIYKAGGNYMPYFRLNQHAGYNMSGNIHLFMRSRSHMIVQMRVDALTDGKAGTSYKCGDINILEDYLTNPGTSGYNSVYGNICIVDGTYQKGDYFEEIIYVKDYTVEKNRKYYRGSVNCKYDGQLSNIPTLESLNPRGEAFYVYIETYGYLDVKSNSPVIFSGDYSVSGREGVHAVIINNQYYSTWKEQNMNCKMNKILFKLTQVGAEHITSTVYINGTKITSGIIKHKNTSTDIISFIADAAGQGSLSNYKTFMIFKENPNFTWTDAYCQEITTNGFPNNRLQTEPTIIKLNRFEETIKVGDTISITAEVLPINAKNKTVAWSSSDTNVATVNQSGSVTAKAVGICEIKCRSYNGIEEIVYINVQHQDITKITSKGLICWLDAWDCDNASRPTVWKDRSGRGNNGIIKNFTYDNASGFANGKVYTDASAKQYIDITTEKLPALLAQYKTFTLQVTCMNKAGASNKLIQYGRGSNSHQLHINSNGIYMNGPDWTSYKSDIGTSTYTIVKTSDTNILMYIDGGLPKIISTIPILDDSNIIEHNRILSLFNPNFMNEPSTAGELYSFRLYQRALDEFEIAKNHQYEQTISREEV